MLANQWCFLITFSVMLEELRLLRREESVLGEERKSGETSDRGVLSHHKTTFSLAILLEVGVGDLLLKNKKMMQIRNIAEINR